MRGNHYLYLPFTAGEPRHFYKLHSPHKHKPLAPWQLHYYTFNTHITQTYPIKPAEAEKAESFSRCLNLQTHTEFKSENLNRETLSTEREKATLRLTARPMTLQLLQENISQWESEVNIHESQGEKHSIKSFS